ncbi:MAG: FAD-binding oxidoreductase [Bacteroidia bacterium]|nr:FAD-binding oxidoreductase [Bacteroidia bacterium]
MAEQRVSGWGTYPSGKTNRIDWERAAPLQGMGIPRGLGRSYGDASFYSGGYTWDVRGHKALLAWDEDRGCLVAEAGMSLYEVIQRFLPQGWFPIVVPGTQFVTLGGAFASNIHGKNHHREGSFADHVEWIDLFLPSGEERRVTPADPLFWATAGGMGLTGIITRICMRLARIPSGYIHNQVKKAPDWERVLLTLKEEEGKFPYAVAWLDHFHRTNRGIVHLGRWAEISSDLPAAYRKKPFRIYRGAQFGVPFTPPFRLFNSFGRAVISAWYWYRHTEEETVLPYAPYFFPLDGVQKWNRLWGYRGFLQFQFIVPSEEGFRVIWTKLQKAPARSFLTVVKRLGAQKGPLAFTGPGWTLAIDLPNTPEMRLFLKALIDVVLAWEGKIYLTKDSLLDPQQFRGAYPEWQSFWELKVQADPLIQLRSDLSIRVGLTPP